MMIVPLQTVPQGLTLAIVGISVVFGCLIILYGVYSLIGAVFSGKFKRSGEPDDRTAAAIALALALESGREVKEGGIHDIEPGFISIKPGLNENWKRNR